MNDRNAIEPPGKMPAWLEGLLISFVFGIVLFGDAIAVWLS